MTAADDWWLDSWVKTLLARSIKVCKFLRLAWSIRNIAHVSSISADVLTGSTCWARVGCEKGAVCWERTDYHGNCRLAIVPIDVFMGGAYIRIDSKSESEAVEQDVNYDDWENYCKANFLIGAKM